MTRAPEAGVPLGRIATPRLVYVVIAVCAAVAALLRLYQLARPGYLLGVTEYDDGVQFGDAVRLVNGVIPYRDFVVMQPPGSVLLMAPVAALAKVIGTAWGLAITRLLTAAADIACVVLLGLLVRHRGPVATAIACGVYAVYPDALVAAHTFLLEPWLNLFCLLGALMVFDGDQVTDRRRRLAWGGVLFGVATAVKIWAIVPLVVICVLVARRPRHLGALAGGAAAGLGVLVLPFLIMAPGALVKDVLVNQYVRDNIWHNLLSLPRLSNLAGFGLDPGLSTTIQVLVLVGFAAIVPVGYLAVCLAGRRRPAPLDWYALIGLVAVVAMLLWPFNYWSHYGAVAGPFIALVVALPVGLLRPAEESYKLIPLVAVGLVAALLITGMGVGQLAAETRLHAWVSPAARADRLLPPGACVLTNNPALALSSNRFTPDGPGCPAMVDSFGTYLAMTGGKSYHDSRQELNTVRDLWRYDFARARYVWFEPGSQGQIPWTNSLYAYFNSHYRLIGLPYGRGPHDVPGGGIYARRSAPQHARQVLAYHRAGHHWPHTLHHPRSPRPDPLAM
ncbi:MAG TPA: glycosyltransferase family 87 protein [Streptosporangiaceae bacterium]|nr:glycosyltransferase family 87 protein [Streptosporangiaceae bacterium]